MNMSTPSMLSVIPKLRAFLTRKEKLKCLVIAVFALVSSVLEIITTSIIVIFAQIMHQPETGVQYLEKLGVAHRISPGQLVFYSALLLGLVYVIKNGVAIAEVFFQNFSIAKMQYTFQNKLLHRYAETDYGFYLTHNSSKLIQIVGADTEMAFSYGVISLANIFSEGLIFLSLIGIVIYMKPILAVSIFAVAALLGSVLIKSVLPRFYRLGETFQEVRQSAYQHLGQFFHGFKEIVLLGKTDTFVDAYEACSRKKSQIQAIQAALTSLPRLIIEVIFVGFFVAVISFFCLRHENPVQIVGILGGYLYVGFRLMPGLNRIIYQMNTFKSCIPFIDSLYQAYTTTVERTHYTDHANLVFQKNIVLDHVCFRYLNTEKDALSDVSFEIKKGECIGVVGETGSGKSTLIDVFLGLLKPYSGSILIDGTYPADAYQWHKKIGYVPQSIYLIDDSIENNIAFGEHKIDREKLSSVIDAAQLRKFIDALPNGAQTVVGERGVRLSGGERQRIAIARALYRNPEVLIFDEATSALDSDTEARLMETIASVSKDRTVIMIAHRVSTLANCHRVIVMDQGTLKRSVTYSDFQSERKS